MKRLLLLSALALFMTTSSWAYSFSAVNDDGVTIYYNKSGSKATVTYSSSSYNSYSGSVVIPETVTYDGTTYTVTTIGNSAFRSCTGLTSVTIPSSVTEIGSYAFYGSSSLTQVTIPNNVTTIGSDAFYNCSGLTQITIPESVTSIGEQAFYNCTGLTQVNFNATACTLAGYNSYRYRAFCGCSNISTMNFGDNVTIIPEYLCYGLTKLTQVTIPNSVTIIGNYAFHDCTGITKVTIGNSVTSIGYQAFSGCTGLTGSLTIPNSVTSIGYSAFYGCSGLTSVTIGSSVTIIDDWAFENCTGLTGTLTIPNSVTSIGGSAFYGCTGLTSVTIPNSVTEIGSGAFMNCTKLTSVTIPESLTEISNNAFSGCTGLTDITIPNSVTEIGQSAFSSCEGLTSITIPESVTSIGSYAFEDCTGLVQVTFNALECTSSSLSPFSGCTNLTKVDFGDQVTIIPGYLFYGCSGLTSVTIPSSVTTIEYDAFGYCSGLMSVTIPENVTMIGGGAFENCTGLTQVNFNATACTYAGYNLYSSAFYGCSNLSTVIFGDNVTIIPDYLFNNCTGLTDVTSLNIVPPSLSNNTFERSVNLKVPKDALLEYAKTDIWSEFSKIYAESHGEVYYPVPIYYEGVASITVSGGDEDGAIATKGSSVMFTKTGSSNIVYGLVVHNSNDITDVWSNDGSYSETVSEYHKNNAIYYYSLDSENFYDITVSEAGQVLEEITVSNINSVYSLKLTGDINGTDIKTIRRMTNLKVLDISDANIVSGGDYYYNEEYKTSNDKIGDYFFYEMTPLKCVRMPDNVTNIGGYAFYNCNDLITITIPESVTSIGSYAFYECTKLTEVIIPNSVTEIGSYSFWYCSGLTTLILEDGDKTLSIPTPYGWSPWLGCPLTSLYLGRNLSFNNSSYSAFKNNTTLTTLTIGEKVTKIPSNTFYNCTRLTQVSIGESVETIGDSAFGGCTSLKSVTIPESVTTIGNSAFGGCENITTIYTANPTPPNISSETFSGVDKQACTLYVPIGSLNVYWLHTYWGEFYNIKEYDVTGIGNVTYSSSHPKEMYRYTLDGKMIGAPQKGVNIIRYSDGTVRKVQVK